MLMRMRDNLSRIRRQAKQDACLPGSGTSRSRAGLTRRGASRPPRSASRCTRPPGRRAVSLMVTVEIGAVPGFVGITFTAGDDRVELVLTPDEARDLSNAVGEGIQAASASRTGAMI